MPEPHTLPPLLERAPHLVLPSRTGSAGAEAWLGYFREDARLNDWHERWHALHPVDRPLERRGERLWHRYQQLLARYDTERLAFGLPRVVPLADLASPLAEGYDSGLPGFAPRLPDQVLRGLPGYDIADHALRRDRLFTAASTGMLWHRGEPLLLESLELLANTAESNPGSVEGEAWADPLSHYGAYYRQGLALLAHVSAKAGLSGVLASTATALRDPLFYRWQRHVDDLLDTWQRLHLPPQELGDGPAVRLRKWLGEGIAPAHQSPDILVCLRRDIPGAEAGGFDAQRWGEATFGGAHWDKPPPALPATTNTLSTRLRQHPVRLPDGQEVLKPQLEHEEFFYFFRLENLLPQEQTVTVRVFLAADVLAEERRGWIEMDRFTHTLRPSERAVVCRPARASSVVQGECGWPYPLLLPRGRPEGMLFRLLLMVTGQEQEREPEARELGYPFNRPLPSGRMVDLIAAQPHMATRNLFIHHVGP